MHLTVVPVRKRAAYSVSILIVTMCLSAASYATVTGYPTMMRPYPAEKDTILVQKQTTSKRHRIKLYPDAGSDVLFFSVRGLEGKVYQLFLFDVAGNLVKQANIKNKQTTVLNNIEKGNYLFEIFSDDERIENGQVIIR